jgi:hypothetical protein
MFPKEKGPKTALFRGIILLPVGLADLMKGTLRRFHEAVNWDLQ